MLKTNVEREIGRERMLSEGEPGGEWEGKEEGEGRGGKAEAEAGIEGEEDGEGYWEGN